MRYRNTKTVAVIETYGRISGNDWQAEEPAFSADTAREKKPVAKTGTRKKTANGK